MNLEEFAHQIRSERPDPDLDVRIIKARRTRHKRQRYAFASGGLGATATVAVLLLSRPALAEVSLAVTETLKEQAIQQVHWRDIRGTKTTQLTITWEGDRCRTERGSMVSVFDSKVHVIYFGDRNEVYFDAPSEIRSKPPTLKFLLDPRWKWTKSNTRREGIDVTRHKGVGTFRDHGKDMTFESSVFVERGAKGRIVACEIWSENHTYADYWTYKYPATGTVDFNVAYPENAKIRDVRQVRDRLVSAAKSGKKGLVMAIVSAQGDVIVIERGVPKVDETRFGRVLMDGDDLGSSASYALGMQSEPLSTLGKGFAVHFMPGGRADPIPEFADFVVKSYTPSKSGPVAAAPREYQHVKIERVGSILSFLGRYQKSPTR